MWSKWENYKLSDLGSFKNGANYDKDSYGNDYPIISVKDLYKGRFVSTENLDALDTKALARIDDYLIKKGDIIFARSSVKREGAGQVAYVNDIPLNCIFSGFTIRYRLHHEDFALPLFLVYLFKTPIYREIFQRIATGTTISNLSQQVLSNINIQLPPKHLQKRILSVLDIIDNKIEINIKLSSTFSELSTTIFRSWFIDFDPVIDNALDAGNSIPETLQSRAELRQKVRNSADLKPLPADVRALFPAEFEETELGWVPKGWTLESVAKAININPSVKLPQNTIAKYVDMKSLPTQGYSISEVIEKPYAGGAKFQKNDTLFARITPCLENGKTGFVDFLDEKEIAFGSTEFIVMRGNTKVHYSYVACLARENNFRSHAIQNMVGSSGRQRVQNSCFDSFYIAIPTPSVMSLFAGKVSSYFDKMYSCNLENKSLTSLRDTLLPKLISGELSLEDLPNLVAQTEPA